MTFQRYLRKIRNLLQDPRPVSRAKRRRRLEVEPLEKRLVPVVGAFSPAPQAVTGIGLDGVVRITDSAGFPSSGALLSSGRHILTAAHTVDDNADGLADPGQYKIAFETTAGNRVYTVDADAITVHDNWNGDGYDLAVITLPELAPLTADRYPLAYAGGEIGQTFLVAGYGTIGTGDDGESDNTIDIRTFGFNVFNKLGQDVDYGPWYEAIYGPFGTLAYDFDNGTNDENVMGGLGLGSDEAFAGKGDSGGPLFLIDDADTFWLAGITSFRAGGSGTEDIDDVANSTFGEIGFATRVFDYVGWIQSQVNAEPYDLTVDMSNQPGGDDGDTDTIEARLSGPSGATFELFINGQLLHRDPSSRIKSLKIVGSGDRDEITVSGALHVPVQVFGRGGEDTLTIDDTNNFAPVTVHLENVSLDGADFGKVTLSTDRGAAGIKKTEVRYVADGLSLLTVKAGTPDSSYFTSGNTVIVESTPSNGTTFVALETGYGSDQVYVNRVSSPLSIAGQNGLDTVIVGQLNSLAQIRGSLGVTNEFGSTELTLIASADNADHQVELGSAGDWGNYVQGLAPALIFWGNTGIGRVNMFLGDGQDTVNLPSVPTTMMIHTGFGDDSVSVAGTSAYLTVDLGPGRNQAFVGGEYGLDPIQRYVNIKATDGTTSLVIDDRGEQYATEARLTANSFSREGMAPITFADVYSLAVFGGNGGNTFEVQDTLPLSALGSFTRLYTGEGRDAVNVRGTTSKLGVDFQGGDIESLVVGGPESGLDLLRETVYLFSGGPGLSVVVDDSGTQSGQATIIDNDGLRRLGAGEIDFFMADGFSLHVNGGPGGNVYDIRGKRGNLSLQAGSGNDEIYVGAGGRLSDLGHFVINGQGGTDTLNLFDHLETAARTYDFFTVQGIPVFTTQGTTVVLWDNQTEVVALYAGRGSDTVNAQQLVAKAALLVDAGEGNDTVTGSAGRDLLMGGPGVDQLSGGDGEDVLVAGGTAYHADPAALAAIMAEWARTDVPYADRVEHLLNGGGLNGTSLLNLASYTMDEGQNTLTGAAGLDLFYGSKARDTHDWNGAAGEVFIDPDARERHIRIDAIALPGSYLALDYVAYDGDAPFSVELTPGQHMLYTLGGNSMYFSVTADGTVDYDPALEGVLTGSGSSTLTVHGAQVQIDASALPGSYVSLDYVAYDGDAPINASLLPGQHILYTLGGNSVYFSVAADGTVDYDPALEGVLTGSGSSTLTVHGAQVQIDASALPGSYVSLDYVAYDGDALINASLLPGQHILYTLGGNSVYFSVAADGTVDYDPALEGVLTGRGSSTLTVHGAQVQIDASALPGSYVSLDYVAYDGDAPINAAVLPGQHILYTLGGNTLSFSVAADGTVNYDPALESVLTGSGSSTLTVHGAQVQIDASALPGSYVSLDYVAYDGDAPINASLLPGQHVLYTLGGNSMYFSVAADGTVDYDPALEGILTGSGSSTLTVHGAQVQIDASALPGSYLSLDYVAYDGDAPINASLLPGQHVLYTLGGNSMYFSVAADGTVDYDPALEGILTGSGSSTLTVHGAQVQIDASALPGSYLSLDYVAYDGDAPINASLLPGQHILYTLGGNSVYFSVAADGTVDYDPALEGVLTGRGSSTLTVYGAQVQIDASALPGSYLSLDYVAYDGDAPINASLLPGQHILYTLDGNSVYFSVAADGTVDYDPALEGVLTGRGTRKLVYLSPQ